MLLIFLLVFYFDETNLATKIPLSTVFEWMKKILEIIKLFCEMSEMTGTNVVVVVGATMGVTFQQGEDQKSIK